MAANGDDADRSCVYGLRNQTRCVSALTGEADRSIFLIGTLGLATNENELHVVEHLEDRDALAHVVFRHPHELHKVSSCYTAEAKNVIATAYNVVGERAHRMRATLWRMDRNVIDQQLSLCGGGCGGGGGGGSGGGAGDGPGTSRSLSRGRPVRSSVGSGPLPGSPPHSSQNSSSSQPHFHGAYDLEPLVTLDDKFSKSGISEVLFDPSSGTSKVVGRDYHNLAVYSLTENLSGALLGATITLGDGSRDPTNMCDGNAYLAGLPSPVSPSGLVLSSHAAAWNPHSSHQVAVAYGNKVCLVDVRSSKTQADASFCAIAVNNVNGNYFGAGRYGVVRALDYNPNRPHQLGTGGDDGYIRFWDLRNTSLPVLELPSVHSHWVQQLQYNRYHDQLVISSGSDHAVVLSSVSSISTLPIGGAGGTTSDNSSGPTIAPGEGGPTPLEDGTLVNWDHHEDSVYALAWSTADPWVFCSASYDGRVLMSVLPNTIKWKIIME